MWAEGRGERESGVVTWSRGQGARPPQVGAPGSASPPPNKYLPRLFVFFLTSSFGKLVSAYPAPHVLSLPCAPQPTLLLTRAYTLLPKL